MKENSPFHLLGVSFRKASLAVRESLAFNDRQALELLQTARTRMPNLEALVVSTCNRSEFYLTAADGPDPVAFWLDLLQETRPGAAIGSEDCSRYHLQNEEAIRHLFRVGTGLDSAILGDVQILGQLKRAQALAGQAGTLGGYLSQLLSQVVRAGKRARSDTGIGRGAASIGSALAGMLVSRQDQVSESKPQRVVLIGAGELGRTIHMHLAKRRLGEIILLNRTLANAHSLAEHSGGMVLPWSQLEAAVLAADIVVLATSASQPVLRRPFLDRLAGRRSKQPILIVDAGMPRNVEPGSTLEVWNIDQIKERQEEVLEQRQAAIPAVEQIIQEELSTWNQWRAAQPLERLIKRVYQEAFHMSSDIAPDLADVSELGREQAQQFLLRSFNRLLCPHARKLRRMNTLAPAPI